MYFFNIIYFARRGIPVVKLLIFGMFHRRDFGGLLVCCLGNPSWLNSDEKLSVAICSNLNRRMTGL